MKNLINYCSAGALLVYLIFLSSGCSKDWIDEQLDCEFYSYIKVASTCECLVNEEPNCEVNYSQLTEKEYDRISALFDESGNECIEISGLNFSGKNFSGMAKRPFVNNCHQFL
ncbi:hypothetical protein [Christiangramia crocea]|uniref:Lipoprotein n=1 Tax=Christiangramia crocea TaxID=2904124 RepID=A0A9X1UX85_9FLAO|nr:hypothetical protein [Gramella crocea]MCG9971179.1 hypothetical protein [Gramella crocea]